MSKTKINKEEIQERMTLLLQVMQQTMLTTNIAIGFDLDKKKLALVDVETKATSRVDLGELNGIFVKRDNPELR